MIDKVEQDLKLAMKNQDKFTVSVLRMLKSEFINESRKGSFHELSEEDVIKVIKKQVKTRKDSIKEYMTYGKLDQVNQLEQEVDILVKYLPEEMTEEQITAVIDSVFQELQPTSIKEMGTVMKAVSAKLTNADMSLVSRIIKDRLN